MPSVRSWSYLFGMSDPGGESHVAGQREAHELLLIEEADAWFEYLEATRAQSALRYKEVEPWAWARLTQRLRAIKTRRPKLKPAAEAAEGTNGKARFPFDWERPLGG